MGLIKDKTYNLANATTVQGDYWTIKNYQYDKNDQFLAVYLELYADKQSYKNGDALPLTQIILTYKDVEFDYKDLEKAGKTERKEVYRYIKEEVPNEIRNNPGPDVAFLSDAADDLQD